MKQNLKIALVCKRYTPHAGGMERYTVHLARQLKRAGHAVHVYANRWQEDPGIVFHRVAIFPLSLPVRNLSFALFAKRQLKRAGMDIIHSMERGLFQDIYRASDGIVPVHLEHRYPGPVMRRFKSVTPRRLALIYLERKMFSPGGCRVIMTNSHLVKQQIMQYYSVPPDRIRVIYNGVDPERFNPRVRDLYREAVREAHGIAGDEMLLLFVSNDHKRKGLMTILQAVQAPLDERIRLMVIGKKGRFYENWAENHLGRGRVLFTGPRMDVETYYAASDLFVFPTGYDAFANVCLEAMACGVPVITTRNNGASELIEDGKQGFVLREGTPEELAMRIKALLPMSEREKMGREAAEKAKAFTLENHVRQVLRLYGDVCLEAVT